MEANFHYFLRKASFPLNGNIDHESLGSFPSNGIVNFKTFPFARAFSAYLANIPDGSKFGNSLIIYASYFGSSYFGSSFFICSFFTLCFRCFFFEIDFEEELL